jgi:hypothetical protein
MTSWRVDQRESEGRRRNNLTTTTAEFKTMLGLYTPVDILEQEIDDRRRGKFQEVKFFCVILEGGLLLSDQEITTIMTTSVVPSGKGLPTDSPEAAPAAKEAVVTQTTTPHKESNQEEVEVSS